LTVSGPKAAGGDKYRTNKNNYGWEKWGQARHHLNGHFHEPRRSSGTQYGKARRDLWPVPARRFPPPWSVEESAIIRLRHKWMAFAW
jgi:hypothetical protein